ncbi:DUF2189 domain-containing protein [Sphingomonas limnosediminicola]|jgi:uncharacterized membrane protein|uniref:DUF2189 domain-containing protein n=1 Tax=Sphingomonas limnosediminicola TaxID=940133 RepID=A0ABP7KUU7_9SPHN
MATNTMRETQTPARAQQIPIRTITSDDLRFALKQGLDDFLTMRGDILIAGLVYTLVGVAAVVMTTNRPLIPFLFPVVAGVGLLGPVAAVGFYELARRREDGHRSNWSHFFDVLKRPAADDMGMVAGLLMLVFFLWLIAAGALYAVLFGWATPTSIAGFFESVLTTPKGWALIIAGGLVGAVFGWVVLSMSVASMPMLVDCDVSASEAVSASWRAAQANKGLMLRWGLIVVGLLVLGIAPLFVGLAFVLPWLGYSTWHLYTRLIDREHVPGRRCDA